jgi:hypothetical protein
LFSYGKNTFPNLSNPNAESGTIQNLGFTFNTRYYFAKIPKVHFFGEASVGFEKMKTKYNDGLLDDYSQSFENYQVGVGANIFMNSEIAFEPTLMYGIVNYNGENSGGSDFIQTQSFSFNVKMNNFVNLSFKNQENEGNKFIRKGRQIVGGEIGVSRSKYDFSNFTETYYSFNPQFGQFLTNNILVKCEIKAFGSFNSSDNQTNRATLSGYYYIPVSKRFYVYPALEVETFTSSARNTSTIDIFKRYNLSGLLGGSYFLSNNIALDATFIKLKKSNQVFESLFGVGMVRLLYFIR